MAVIHDSLGCIIATTLFPRCLQIEVRCCVALTTAINPDLAVARRANTINVVSMSHPSHSAPAAAKLPP